MNKKLVLFSVLALIIAGSIFSQEKKHSVMIDTVPLISGIIVNNDDSDLSCFGLAAAYEFNIAPHYSIGARLGFYVGDQASTDYSIFMMSAHGRWYPLAEGPEKLFLDVGLGFYTWNIDAPGIDTQTDLTFELKAGWKHMFNSMFYIEPSLGYILSDAEAFSSSLGFQNYATGIGLYQWNLGLGIGIRF
jgi:hypothetical protein